MTPDDMEAIVSEWLAMADEAEVSHSALKSVVICQTEINFIRALLLDYQERGRALEAASPVVPVGREEIARIIDPLSWRRFDRHSPYAADVPHETAVEWYGDLQPSLDDADAILAALRPTDTGREG
jgi:hypothetical protein